MKTEEEIKAIISYSLKPCPFCNAEGKLHTADTPDFFSGKYIQCQNCGASTQKFGWTNYFIEVSKNTFQSINHLLAVRAWNIRPNEGTFACPECGISSPHNHQIVDNRKLVILV